MRAPQSTGTHAALLAQPLKAPTVAPRAEVTPTAPIRWTALCEHNADCAPHQLRAVEVADGALRCGDVKEFDEAEPAWLAGLPLSHDPVGKQDKDGGRRTWHLSSRRVDAQLLDQRHACNPLPHCDPHLMLLTGPTCEK